MSDNVKLLPCPFCGSANIDPEGWVSTERKGPACDDCSGSADTVELWNRRPRPPGWPDPLESPQAEAIRAGKIDDTEIRNLFDTMERELRLHRECAASLFAALAPSPSAGEPTCWTSEVSLRMAAAGVPAVIHAYPPPVEPVALYRTPPATPVQPTASVEAAEIKRINDWLLERNREHLYADRLTMQRHPGDAEMFLDTALLIAKLASLTTAPTQGEVAE